MGKTGTTSDFRDALFVGSTYGPQGITVAVRVGFDDNRTLGPRETGGRTALPIFQEIVARIYRDALLGRSRSFHKRWKTGSALPEPSDRAQAAGPIAANAPGKHRSTLDGSSPEQSIRPCFRGA